MSNPPMVIRYTVNPMYITDNKWFSPRDNAKLIDSVVVTREARDRLFHDKNLQQWNAEGYPGMGHYLWDSVNPQMIVIRDTGMTDIEFSGEQVTVGPEVFVKKEGNIE